jgi:hypothetical protein
MQSILPETVSLLIVRFTKTVPLAQGRFKVNGRQYDMSLTTYEVIGINSIRQVKAQK